ncbi:MAG: glycosyltransferase [Pseudomonadota bacterium]
MNAFSVVIPLYNKADLIERTVRSVLGQTCQDFEIVIVDDGSSDDYESALSAIEDTRIRVIRQENQGAGAARNRGVDEATGRYIAFLDSDDMFLPHHLETMAGLLEGTENTVVYAPVIVDRGADRRTVKPYRGIRRDENMATYLICDRGFVQSSGLVVPRDLALNVRYRPDVGFGDDTDYAIRLQLAGYTFRMASKPSVIWHDLPDPNRLSNDDRSLRDLQWLEDLRADIPASAYHGYRGWHVAKSRMATQPLEAFRLFFGALFRGSYPLTLATVIFLQLTMPRRAYRDFADLVIRVRNRTASP